MQSKKIFVFIVIGFVAICYMFAENLKPDLQKKLEFLKMMYRTYTFDKSYDYRYEQESLGKYFTEPIYKKLTGNDLIGFIYDQGFTYNGAAFNLREFKTTVETGKYRNHMVNALGEVAKEGGFTVTKNAQYDMGLCLVALVDQMTKEGLPGVVLEIYVKNVQTGKVMLLRIKAGSKKGWYEGMKNAWRYVYLIMEGSKRNG